MPRESQPPSAQPTATPTPPPPEQGQEALREALAKALAEREEALTALRECVEKLEAPAPIACAWCVEVVAPSGMAIGEAAERAKAHVSECPKAPHAAEMARLRGLAEDAARVYADLAADASREASVGSAALQGFNEGRASAYAAAGKSLLHRLAAFPASGKRASQ